jgi:hypothetical protein
MRNELNNNNHNQCEEMRKVEGHEKEGEKKEREECEERERREDKWLEVGRREGGKESSNGDGCILGNLRGREEKDPEMTGRVREREKRRKREEQEWNGAERNGI